MGEVLQLPFKAFKSDEVEDALLSNEAGPSRSKRSETPVPDPVFNEESEDNNATAKGKSKREGGKTMRPKSKRDTMHSDMSTLFTTQLGKSWIYVISVFPISHSLSSWMCWRVVEG